MKKLFIFLSLAVISTFINAQKGNDKIGIGAQMGIPTGDFGEVAQVGFGAYGKIIIGVSNEGEVSLSTGFTSFAVKDIPPGSSAHIYIIPILVGYRHNFDGFYLEPQLGMGVYGAKATYAGQSSSDSKSAFTFGAGVGYIFGSNFDLGISYHYGKIKDATSPFTVFGVHLGYNIPLQGRGTKRK